MSACDVMGKVIRPESYNNSRQSVCQVDPQLRDLTQDSALTSLMWLPWNRAKPRVVAMSLDDNGFFGPATEYQDSKLLLNHLQQPVGQDNAMAQRSVYILEALSKDFAADLGSYFQLHPALFMDHERLVSFDNRPTGEGGGTPYLPSTIYAKEYLTIKYHEPLLLSTLPTDFRNLCDVSGRHIAVTRIMGKFSEVGVARRKCTWWSRKTEAGGWDCLIICDPPVKRVLTDYSGKAGYNVTTSPCNNGYRDFMPHKEQMKSRLGPPRTSFLEDIVFYLRIHSGALELSDPSSLKIFVEKIAASHYLKLAEFLQTVIEKIQFNLSRRHDLTGFAIAAVEEQWSDVQGLERRIGEYQDDLTAIMLHLQILAKDSNSELTLGWKDSAADFQYLYSRFQLIGQRANSLNNSVVALAGLINNRQAVKAQELGLEASERSIREAKSAKALTTLGVIFIPLAYVASLFSMADLFRPGERLFWVYFVVAVPMIGLVVLGYFTLKLGYIPRGQRWIF